MGSDFSRACHAQCLGIVEEDSPTRSERDLAEQITGSKPSQTELVPVTSTRGSKRRYSALVPDIALTTPRGSLLTLLQDENENWREKSVDSPTVPPGEMSLTRYVFTHMQWYSSTALIDGITGKSYKYDELLKMVWKVASGIAKLGVRRADKVIVLSNNTPEWVVCLLAGIALGTIVCPLDVTASPDELAARMRELRPTAVIVSPAQLETVTEACVSDPKVKIITLSESKKWFSFADLLHDDGSCFPEDFDDITDTTRDTCVILYSADVTETPRPVHLSHSNLVMNLVQLRERPELIWQNGVDVVLGVVPFSHPFGLVGVLFSSLVRGCTLVTAPHWELRKVLHLHQQHKISVVPLLPRWMDTLATHPLAKRSEQPFSADVLVYAAGHFPVARHAMQLARLGIKSLVSVYGLTEATAVVAVAAAVDATCVPAGGFLLRDTHCKLLELSGVPRTSGSGSRKVGEVLVSGPQVVTSGGELDGVDEDGWLHTDIGELMPSGAIKILGHKEDFLAMSKQRLPPNEMETIILRHPAVSDVTVVMAPQSASYRAQVVLNRCATDVSNKQIRDFVNGCVSPRNRLEDVELVPTIPRSAKGKVLRLNLNLDD